jgi:hypothetical protein
VLQIPFEGAFRFDPSPTFAELRDEELEWRRLLVSGLAELPVNLGL